jgi:hypothetical protein
MKPTDLDSAEAEVGPETLQALADQIVSHQSSIENYYLNSIIDFWFVNRLGLEPLSVPGRLAGGIFHVLTFLVPALILTALPQTRSDMPLVSWIIVAVGISGFLSTNPLVYRLVVPSHLSWTRAIFDEADLHRLRAWCEKWFNYRVAAPVSGALTLVASVAFYLLAVRGSGVPVAAGILYIGAFCVFLVMQAAYGMFMMSPEAYVLTTCNYELYPLSPADSVVVRRSLLGYNRLGAVTILVATAATLFVLVLLPAGSGVIWPVVLFMLLLIFVSAGGGVMIPRLVLGRIIRRTKEAEMETLQVRLKDLLPRVGELTEDEREEFTQLQETHDAIRDSPENLLPLGEFAKIVGALLLSTLTVLVTAFAQEWFAELAKRFLP